MLIKLKPNTPGQRGTVLVSKKHLSKEDPYKPLTRPISKTGGRNNQGRITSRRIGGRVKRKYRIIDFKRKNLNGTVQEIEYDPNRSAFIARIKGDDNQLSYILAPHKLKPGQRVESGKNVPIKIGNAMPLINIPVGTLIHNIELKPGNGGQLIRSAGSHAQLIQKLKDRNLTRIKLISGEHRLIPSDSMATIGIVSNLDNSNQKIGKAGRSRWLGIKPTVRGSAMNPIDHPHGGGEGKTGPGRHPTTPWGKLTKGPKTRNKNKNNPMIIQKRI